MAAGSEGLQNLQLGVSVECAFGLRRVEDDEVCVWSSGREALIAEAAKLVR